jgi:hypothetical protein
MGSVVSIPRTPSGAEKMWPGRVMLVRAATSVPPKKKVPPKRKEKRLKTTCQGRWAERLLAAGGAESRLIQALARSQKLLR